MSTQQDINHEMWVQLPPECDVGVTVDECLNVALAIRYGDETLTVVMPDTMVAVVSGAMADARAQVTAQRQRNWTPADTCPDDLWAFVKPFLVSADPTSIGRPAKVRETYTAVLYVLVTGCPWSHLPERFDVAPGTAFRWYRYWSDETVWHTMYRASYDSVAGDLSAWSRNLCQVAVVQAGRRPALDVSHKYHKPRTDIAEAPGRTWTTADLEEILRGEDYDQDDVARLLRECVGTDLYDVVTQLQEWVTVIRPYVGVSGGENDRRQESAGTATENT